MKDRVVLIGPPASGKGTQAELIRARFGIPVVSPGQVLREEAESGSALGLEAQKLTACGHLVPDEMVVDVIQRWLDKNDARFVFDGFPRTVGQAVAVDKILATRNTPLDVVIAFDADWETLRERVSNRLVCRGCVQSFSIGIHVSGANATCPVCHGILSRRHDDTAEVLKSRMSEYQTKTAPVITHYEQLGLVRRVASVGRPEEVFNFVAEILQEP